MLDHPAELSDPSLADVLVRREIFDGLQEVIAALLADRSRADLLERGQAAGLPCAVMHTPAEFVADEQLDARDYFVTLVAADGSAVRMPGAPFRSSPALFEITCAAPHLGEHNHDVYVTELGHTADELRCWRDDGLV
jgi:crotonobetainyl-CoA:carnitine CoA-transferase CaiB-like acyl-CoA transferase